MINLINAQSIKGEMSDETIVTLNRFWDSAQDVAMACLTLAKRIGYQAGRGLRTGAVPQLWHSADAQALPGYMAVLEEAYASTGEGQRIVDIENRVLSTNHAVVGYFTAKSWNLPLYLCDAIANHHNALSLFSDDSGRDAPIKTLLAILKMAEHICACHRVLGGQPEDHEWDSVARLVLDYVGLSDYDFVCLKESIRELGVG